MSSEQIVMQVNITSKVADASNFIKWYMKNVEVGKNVKYKNNMKKTVTVVENANQYASTEVAAAIRAVKWFSTWLIMHKRQWDIRKAVCYK